MIGQSLAHYRILAKLGAGGMGEVYEAQDDRLGRRVALKILPAALAARPEALGRFRREARALAALNHPNIVTIHSVDEAGGYHFLTMERVEGRPLSALIPGGGFGLEKLFALGIPLADALASAHQSGIGHRDLKPSNVMVTHRDQIKVIDFGLATLFESDSGPVDPGAPTLQRTVGEGITGTPAYMAPEQIEGRSIDYRTDIFSLGIVLHEMATGRRPFQGDSAVAVMASILRDAPPALSELRPELPGDLGRIVRRCLQKDPDDRYQSMQDVRSELKELEEETRAVRRPASTPAVEISPAAPPGGTAYNNLPASFTSFVGRERETAEVVGLLSGTADALGTRLRLLTLTGPGGTGKTRLALQVAGSLLEHFPDGVCLVELAALSDPSLVPQTVVSALGLLNVGGRPPVDLITHHLGTKRALLILDNCEHLVAACADLVGSLLRACPRLQILATSREALRLPGETVWPVPSLSMPDLMDGASHDRAFNSWNQYEAIRLFVERAGAVTPGFTLTESNAQAVARLCHRLDGIPLAIELAAARTRLLPVEQLLGRVQDRFRLLTGGSRTALPRQQTLRALVDWSYDLLSEQEQILFERLSVFAGGWTVEAAEEVCSDATPEGATAGIDSTRALRPDGILDLLGTLLEKSMLVVERTADGTVRHRLLETLRQYGQQKLEARGDGAGDGLRNRHATHFTVLGEQAATGIHGPDQARWLVRLESELDNLRAALEWGEAPDANEERVNRALRLAASLHIAWMRRGHGREARRHFDTLLAHRNSQNPTPDRAYLLVVAGSAALWQDAENSTAHRLLTEGLLMGEATGDVRVMASAHQSLGQLFYNGGNLTDARLHHDTALRLGRASGDLLGIRISLENLADLAATEGNSSLATQLYGEALLKARELGDHHGIASVLQSMGVLAHATGGSQPATNLIGEALSIMHRIGCLHCSARYLNDLVFVTDASAEPERVVKILGAADALRERTGIVVPESSAGKLTKALTSARSRLGEAAFATFWNEGRAMSLHQATHYALGGSEAIPPPD